MGDTYVEGLGYVCGALWAIFGLTQTSIGFESVGECDANEELPLYTGIHGLLNMGYGIGLILFTNFGYEQFVFRLVFYFAWIVEGTLCITGIAIYSKTTGYLKECNAVCKKCDQGLLIASVVTESFIFTLYILVTLSMIGYELESRCEHCHQQNVHNQSNNEIQPHGQIQVGQTAGRNSTIENEESNRRTVHIHNMYVTSGSQMPFVDT